MGSEGTREIKREEDAAVTAPIPDFEPLAGGLKVIYFVLAGLLAFTYVFPLALDPSLHLLLLATTTVACGCIHNSYLYYATLKWSEDHASDAELYLKSEEAESISEEDAWKFPVMGSCVLLGLFLVFKFVPFDLIKKYLIPAYVSFICLFALSGNMVHIIQLLTGRVQEKKTNVLFKLPFLEEVTKLDLITGIIALGVVAAYWYFGKPWILNNIMGVSFCLLGIKLMAISTYKAGAIMMLGLFVYDIFWVFGSKPVFGSNVMVTVAKNVDAPILLKFPRAMNETVPGGPQLEFSMLGLGDIVVPGLFLACVLRFDLMACEVPGGRLTSFPHFLWCMVAYVGALMTTVAAMLLFEAAQPALLYIVPMCLGSTLITAAAKGELGALLAFEVPSTGSDEEDGGDGEEKEKEEKKKDK